MAHHHIPAYQDNSRDRLHKDREVKA
jgi:hypothetical protein